MRKSRIVTCLNATIVGAAVHDIRCVINETDCINVNCVCFDWNVVRISTGCQIVNIQAAIAAAANNLLATIRKGHGKNTKVWFRWIQCQRFQLQCIAFDVTQVHWEKKQISVSLEIPCRQCGTHNTELYYLLLADHVEYAKYWPFGLKATSKIHQLIFFAVISFTRLYCGVDESWMRITLSV